MKKTVALLLCALLFAALLAGCGEQPAPAPTPAPAAPTPAYPWDFAMKNGSIDALKVECDQPGEVVTLEYDTPAYAVNDLLGLNETLHKSLTVYLPYGYDAAKPYNVLYLLHGTKGEADGPMEQFWLVQWGKETCAVLDNMIKNGLCEPLIVVCPNYYSPVEGHTLGDAEAKALSEKLGDDILFADKAEDGGELDNPQNIWPVYFGQELRNNIIPAVESVYSSYAQGDVSEANLIATREHRAFAGLSRGSMTVARSGLTDNADIFAYFGNFSGIWQQFAPFKTALTETFRDYPIRFWFNGNGKIDFAKENHEAFLAQVQAEMPDTFRDGENFAYVVLKDGAHMYKSWVVDLYNALLVFFR